MANRSKLIIEIKAQVDDARRKIKSVKKDFMDTFSAISTVALGIGLAGMFDAAINAARQLIGEVVRLGVELGAVVRNLELLGGGAGAARAFIRAVQEATSGLVDRLTAAKIAVSALNYEIADTPDEMARLARIVTILTNGNAELAESFFYMASNGIGSIERLNEFGLSAANVRERIKRLQEANAGMTTDMAFQIAVFEEAAEKADVLAESLDTTAAAAQRAGAAIKELELDAGEAINVLVGNSVKLLELLNERFAETAESGAQMENAFLAPAVAGEALGAVLRLLIDGQIELNQAGEAYRLIYNQVAVEMGMVSTEASRADDELEALAKAEKEAATATDDATAAAQRRADALDDMSESVRNAQRAAQDAEKDFSSLGSSLDLSGALEGIGDQVSEGLQGIAQLRGLGDGETATREDIAQIVLRELMRQTDDPEIIWRFRVAAGLATAQEIQWERELFALARAAAEGKITPEAAAQGVGLIAGGGSAAGVLPGGRGPQGITPGGSLGGSGRPTGPRQDQRPASLPFLQGGEVRVMIELNNNLLDARIEDTMGNVFADVAGGNAKGVVPRGKLGRLTSGQARR